MSKVDERNALSELNPTPSTPPAPESLNKQVRCSPGLAQWFHQAIGLQQIRVQVRCRGNALHILCEGVHCPDAAVITSRLIRSIAVTNVATLLPPDQPPIYQIFLYGRALKEVRPRWTEPVYLNQLDRYLEQLDSGEQHKAAAQKAAAQLAAERSVAHSPTVSFPIAAPQNSQLQKAQDLVTPEPERTLANDRQPERRQPIRPASSLALQPSLSSALVVSNRSLACQGQPEAIASYLSETMSRLGVAVRVSAKAIECEPGVSLEQRNLRLCIVCESSYSPEPAMIAEPIAQQLRQLNLEKFRDAVIFSQVQGEARTDWTLRIDLTPPEEMLREWARWGDVESIALLLNQSLKGETLQVTASLKEVTLHIVCERVQLGATQQLDHVRPVSPSEEPEANLAVSEQQRIMGIITELLETIAPQAIHAAAIYGLPVSPTDSRAETPAWIEWLTLPAANSPALAESAFALAKQGDQPALIFLLNRLLNPDLKWRLATGGIRVQALYKDDLLHIMGDAPICPYQSQVGPAVTQLLKQLQIPHLAGVRVYGRRSGHKRPFWSYGIDFKSRSRLVPEAMPEFAASDAYVADLLGDPDTEVLRPELTPQDLQTKLSRLTQQIVEAIQQSLVRSHLFALKTEDSLPQAWKLSDEAENNQFVFPRANYRGAKVALVWSALGLLLTVQADVILGQILHRRAETAKTTALAPASKILHGPIVTNPSDPAVASDPIVQPQISLRKSSSDPTAFNPSDFTQPGSVSSVVSSIPDDGTPSAKILRAEALKPKVSTTQLLAAKLSPYPTFNSRQLDEKLALYYQHLAESGPPDILIVGSSRALRGIDPVALQKALAAQGYPGLTIFNFGVNGATAQVVDVLLRQILTPAQMPKLILWADGARAFNSGRVDVTYNAIVVSAGYKALTSGAALLPNKAAQTSAANAPVAPSGTSGAATTETQTSLTASYQEINTLLNQKLASLSATYGQRDRLKNLLQTGTASLVPKPKLTLEQLILEQSRSVLPTATSQQTAVPAIDQTYAVDFDGFLPLSVRFNPATYYQKYSKVSGDFDGDYEAFQLEGKQTQALDSLLKTTQTYKIPLVFINLPLTQDYLDPVRSAHEEEFQQYLLRVATEKGFVFRNLAELWPTANDYFSDPSHLNRYGAYEVSNHLTQDPMIPWPRSPQR